MIPEIDENKNMSEVYKHLAKGMDDIKNGRYQDVDSAFDDILSFLDITYNCKDEEDI